MEAIFKVIFFVFCVGTATVGFFTVCSLLGLVLYYGPLRVIWNVLKPFHKYLDGSIMRLGLVSAAFCAMAGFMWSLF